jgi:cardiolipin synthase
VSLQKIFSIPNTLSLLRILLTPLILYFYLNEPETYKAALFFAIAAWTDWADGYTARRFHQTSFLGQMLDPVADKILVMSTFFVFYWTNALPLWVVLLVIGRDILILCVAILLIKHKSQAPIAPIMWGKVSTCFQLLLGFIVFMHANHFLIYLITIVVAAFTLLSGLFYAHTLYKWYNLKNR